MIERATWVAVACASLAGCFEVNTSQSPLSTTYAVSNQQKMQSAHHWNVLAMHQADQLAESEAIAGKSLFIDVRNDTSAFGSTYKSLLTSALIANGVQVSSTETGSAKIVYDVSVVEHDDRDPNRMPVGYWTALTAGVWVASEITNPVFGTLALAAANDAFSGNTVYADTDHEVAITTQVLTADRVSFSSSSIYYLNGGDTGNYKTHKNIKLTAER